MLSWHAMRQNDDQVAIPKHTDAIFPAMLDGRFELRLPLPGNRGTLATTVMIDGTGMLETGQAQATIALDAPVELRLLLPDGRGTLAGTLQADGQARLDLAVPGGVERIDGDIRLKGPLDLALQLPGAGASTTMATLDAMVELRTITPGCFCLDIQSTAGLPLLLRLPLPDGAGELDLNITLDGSATLRMPLPGTQGLLQARGDAAGTIALALRPPVGDGQITLRSSLNTPVALSMVVPDGRAKLSAQDTMSSELELKLALPGGGRLEASSTLQSDLQAVAFLPSGRGDIEIATPLHATLQIAGLPIPNSPRTLDLDVGLAGNAHVAVTLPDRHAHARLAFEATLPLAPLVELVRSEIAQQVRVERLELREPRLLGAHELVLPLYIEARKGVLARLETTATLRIDPHSKQVELQAVQAHGNNIAGSAASMLYLNRRVFKPLRHTLLFDPATMLPPALRIEQLRFKAASPDALVLAGEMTFDMGT